MRSGRIRIFLNELMDSLLFLSLGLLFVFHCDKARKSDQNDHLNLDFFRRRFLRAETFWAW